MGRGGRRCTGNRSNIDFNQNRQTSKHHFLSQMSQNIALTVPCLSFRASCARLLQDFVPLCSQQFEAPPHHPGAILDRPSPTSCSSVC